MQRKFLSNLFLVLLLNVLVKPFYILGVDAEFLKRLEMSNPGEYGEYFSLVGLTFIFNIFLDLGLSNYNTRETSKDHSHIDRHFKGILSLRFLLVFLYLILLFGAGVILGYSKHQFYLLSMLGLNQVLVAFILFFRSNLSGQLRFKEDSVIGVLDRVILVAMCSLVLWGGWYQQQLTVELFVWLQTASYGVVFIISLILSVRHNKFESVSVDIKYLKDLLKKSLPYALLILLMTIYYRVDSVMVERMVDSGKREAALYAQGFRFLEAFSMIGYLFAGLLLPIYSKMIHEKNNLSDITYLSFKIIIAISGVLAITVFSYAEEIIEMRYGVVGAELSRSAASLKLLMICFVAMSSTYIFGTILTANGSLKFLNWVAGIGVLLNVALNFWLIQEDGAYGAAQASVITQVLTAIIQLIIAVKIMHISLRYFEIIRILVFALALILIAYFNPMEDWIYGMIFVLISGGILSVLTGVLNVKKGLEILKSREV